MTPKTESGRTALIRALDEGGYEWEDVHALIDAIEQEAASKAVAEVLDRLEKRVIPRFSRSDQPVILSFVKAQRALIASERKP